MLDLMVPLTGCDWLADRELSEINGVACWVVSRDVLVRMKRLAGRPQDVTDADTLDGSADG